MDLGRFSTMGAPTDEEKLCDWDSCLLPAGEEAFVTFGTPGAGRAGGGPGSITFSIRGYCLDWRYIRVSPNMRVDGDMFLSGATP